MSSEAIVFVQSLSLILCIMTIVGAIYMTKWQDVSWEMILLPMLLVVNLTAFLTERVLVKVFGVDIQVVPGFINSWAILLQLHLALTALAVVFVKIASIKRNDKHNE
jgi:hypothetical protein